VLSRLLLPWRGLNAVDVSEGFRGAVSRYVGMLCAFAGQFDDAQLHFEHALAMNQRMGARPWLARTQSDYAQMLRARNGSGDEDRAVQLRAAALATYRELGMENETAISGVPAGSMKR
jgi:uncharacterized protein HemY